MTQQVAIGALTGYDGEQLVVEDHGKVNKGLIILLLAFKACCLV
jgi:hypothetical protein